MIPFIITDYGKTTNFSGLVQRDGSRFLKLRSDTLKETVSQLPILI